MLSDVTCSNTSEIKTEVQLALSDFCCRQILSAISKKAMSVNEISGKVEFCKSKGYRKIHLLKKANLVRVSGDISKEDGCKRFRYLSKINTLVHSVHLEKAVSQSESFLKEVKFQGRSCRGYCVDFVCQGIPNGEKYDYCKRCTFCRVFLKTENVRCPCCKVILRTNPETRRDCHTIKGNLLTRS